MGSVERALALLGALGRIGPASLSALAEAAGCTRTRAFRLLRTLEAAGFARQGGARGTWRLAAGVWLLGRAAMEQGALAAVAAPHLAALSAATGENSFLLLRDGAECEVAALHQSSPLLRLYVRVGQRLPLHAGAGRLLLAHAPDAVRAQVLAARLPRFTTATRTDPAALLVELEHTRGRGWLVTLGEVVEGSVSVSAPVLGRHGEALASLALISPTVRMRAPRPRSLVPVVLEEAAALSAALGVVGR